MLYIAAFPQRRHSHREVFVRVHRETSSAHYHGKIRNCLNVNYLIRLVGGNGSVTGLARSFDLTLLLVGNLKADDIQ